MEAPMKQIPEEEVIKEFENLKDVVGELQTSNRFILKRLNQLCIQQKEQQDACPLCKCQCLEVEHKSSFTRLEARVLQLETRERERQDQVSDMVATLSQISQAVSSLAFKTLNRSPASGSQDLLLHATDGVKQGSSLSVVSHGVPGSVEASVAHGDMLQVVAHVTDVSHTKRPSSTLEESVKFPESGGLVTKSSGSEAEAPSVTMVTKDISGSQLVDRVINFSAATEASGSQASSGVPVISETQPLSQGQKDTQTAEGRAPAANLNIGSQRHDKNVSPVPTPTKHARNLQPLPSTTIEVSSVQLVGSADSNIDNSVDQSSIFAANKGTSPADQSSRIGAQSGPQAERPGTSHQQVEEKTPLKSILKPNFSKQTAEASKAKSGEGIKTVTQTERNHLDGDHLWHLMAAVEKKKGQEAGLKMLGGIHTVLCVDVSDSMRIGSAWQQTRKFFFEYISGLEDVAIEHGIKEEHLALVVFGHETKIIQKFTNNFSELRQAFSAIKLGGPTPMFGGLMMAVAAASASDKTSAIVNGIPVHTRVIFISDGKTTGTNLISGPDEDDSITVGQAKEKVLEIVYQMSGNRMKLTCVPVGDSPDTELLELMATVTGGKMVTPDEGRSQSRNLLLTLNAGSVGKQLIGTHMQSMIKDILSGLDKNFSDEDMSQMMEIITDSQKEIEEEVNSHTVLELTNGDLPPLGTRMERGPDWHWKDQDAGGLGTVVGHKENQWLWIEWDNNKEKNCYCYGQGGQYDVLVVDRPRLLKSDEMIAVGCIVKRGPDWESGDEDGGDGNKGVVIKVKKDGRVIVRWSSTSKGNYRFGASGKFDLEVCNPYEGLQGQGGAMSEAERQAVQRAVSPLPGKHTKTTKNKNKNAKP